MLYQDLISRLQKIKKIEDMNDELAQEILLAGITAQMSVLMQKQKLEDLEAHDASRGVTLKLFDMLLLDIMDRQ